jgi:uncharacterized protein YndB with AHSA1/START domain
MADAPTPYDATQPGMTITRVFDAPRERVWKEWTEPERFADWFGGGAVEVPVSTVSMDVREGGAWRATMFDAAGRGEIRWHGTFLEVVEPERLVMTFSDEPDEDLFELVIVVLNDLGDGRTEMLFEQRGRMSPEQYEAAGQGWSTFFDRMAQRLAGGQAPGTA